MVSLLTDNVSDMVSDILCAGFGIDDGVRCLVSPYSQVEPSRLQELDYIRDILNQAKADFVAKS